MQKLNIETLHQTLKLKRECKGEYHDLRGIGKTTLFWDNITQLVQLPLLKNENKLVLILSFNMFRNEIEHSLMTLKDICKEKQLIFNIIPSKNKSLIFEINKIKFIFIMEGDKQLLRGIRPLLSEFYFLNEGKLISEDLKYEISPLNLTKIYFN